MVRPTRLPAMPPSFDPSRALRAGEPQPADTARHHHLASSPRTRLAAIAAALFATALLLLAPPPAQATNGIELAPSLGIFDVGKGEKAAEAGLELRWRAIWRGLRPAAGFMVTSDEAAYVYAGARYDFPLSKRWWITPSFAAGAYHQGDGKDLGKTLEFRSGLEVAYQITERSRLGVTLYHLSNASLSDWNPGSESLIASWSFLWP
jgi:lipid A 3-O-deacylase